MNLAAWAPAIVTAVIAIVTVVFISGQLTGRIEGQEKTLVKHNDRLDDHDDKLSEHSAELAGHKAWREGYNAGRSRKD